MKIPSIGSLFAETNDTDKLFSSIFEIVNKTSDSISVSILKCETNSEQNCAEVIKGKINVM